MTRITVAKLAIKHDHSKMTAEVTVKAEVKFTPFEYCLMKNCPKTRLFKLKCQLWGEDYWMPDDRLYTLPAAHYYPAGSPALTETATFKATVGEGMLDEDVGKDEIYAKLILTNLFTLNKVTKKSNIVHHEFE